VNRARDLRRTFATLPFAQLPGRGAARDATLVSANNKVYGRDYPYRLSAQFEPPYRAYRIAELLRARRRYDAEYFERMQLDTLSPIDLEIVRDVVRFAGAHPATETAAQASRVLARWDGRYEPSSRAAAMAHALRLALYGQAPPFVTPDGERDLGETLPLVALHEPRTWGKAGGMRIQHVLAPMNFPFLNGAWIPGAGDEYTIHLQEPGFAQGFRAVWDVGDWDRGGIAIPSGESGEPGSAHYMDLTRAWVAGASQPLPFSRAAVERSASSVLILRP